MRCGRMRCGWVRCSATEGTHAGVFSSNLLSLLSQVDLSRIAMGTRVAWTSRRSLETGG